jgi:ribosomal protein L11 methyltransferase
MKWTEVKIITCGEASEAVSEMLVSLGAKGVAIEDPDDIKAQIFKTGSLDYADNDFINNLGEDVIIKVYFSEDVNIDELRKTILQKIENIKRFLDIGKGLVLYNDVDDKDWENEWKKYYNTFNITENIIIQPSWDNNKLPEEKIVIKMDPGMAFGTGTHETTKMCAELLEKYLVDSNTVLDIGCGSGILSIIAAKLGALSITAFDIDNTAIKVSKENFMVNNVEKKIFLKCGILKDISVFEFNIVVANVIADVVIDLGKSLKNYLKKDGIVIVSGIIKERQNDVIKVYNNVGFVFEEFLNLGEWVAIVFRCQDFL